MVTSGRFGQKGKVKEKKNKNGRGGAQVQRAEPSPELGRKGLEKQKKFMGTSYVTAETRAS